MCASLGGHLGEEFLSHIILVLKLEGIIGKEMGKNDIKMVNEIKEKLINDKNMREELLDTIKKIKEGLNMSDLNLDFFKKRPSEELLEKTKEIVKDINPDLLKEFDDIFDDEDDDF